MCEKRMKRRLPFEADESADGQRFIDVGRVSPEPGSSRVAARKSIEAKKGKSWLKEQLSNNELRQMLEDSEDSEEIDQPVFPGKSSSVVENSAGPSFSDLTKSNSVATKPQNSNLEEESDEVELSSDWSEAEEDENEIEYYTYTPISPKIPVHDESNPSFPTPSTHVASTRVQIPISTERITTSSIKASERLPDKVLPAVVPENNGSNGTKQVLVKETPIDFFFHLFTEQFFELIIKETNNQAKILISKTKKPKARIQGWKPLTREDLEVFLALIFLTGHINAPSLNHYWKTNKLYHFPIFRNAMPRDRFFTILKALHFSKTSRKGAAKSSDPLQRVFPLFDIFHRRMREICYTEKEMTMGESMLLWHGCLYVRQYIRKNRHRFDVKLYMLMQPNGVVLRSTLYCGKNDTVLRETGDIKKVVKQLLDDYFEVRHSVYIDNFSCLPGPSSKDLLDKNTRVTRSKKRNVKKNVSKGIVNKKGRVTSEYKKDGICVLKWHSQRKVHVSSEFDPSMMERRSKSAKTSEKQSETSLQCNDFAVDRSDQFLCYYPCKKKTLRWYLKVAFHLFQIIMNNAFLLYVEQSQKYKTTMFAFRESVIKELIYRNRPVFLPTTIPKTQKVHLPKYVPRNDSNRRVRKRCMVCSKKKKRVESVFFCDQCPEKPGLCLQSCFRKYHKY